MSPAAAKSWSDPELLRRVIAREERAWSELVRRFRALIFRCIAKATARHAPDLPSADLDDIFAEVLLQLVRDDYHKLRRYDPARGTKLSSWIGMLAVNAAFDHLRRLGRRPVLDRLDGAPEPEPDGAGDPLSALLEKERWAHLDRILADFSEKDRELVAMCFGEGREPDDIARAMRISKKTVYSKLNKLRAHLRERVRAEADSPIADLAA